MSTATLGDVDDGLAILLHGVDERVRVEAAVGIIGADLTPPRVRADPTLQIVVAGVAHEHVVGIGGAEAVKAISSARFGALAARYVAASLTFLTIASAPAFVDA